MCLPGTINGLLTAVQSGCFLFPMVTDLSFERSQKVNQSWCNLYGVALSVGCSSALSAQIVAQRWELISLMLRVKKTL